MTADAVFVQDGDRFDATELAEGPWQPGALHGGAVAALLVHEFAAYSATPGLCLARLTVEFVRPVPHEQLSAQVALVRPGRRVTLLDAMLRDGEGTEVTRARALLVAPSEAGDRLGGAPPFPGPDDAAANDWSSPDRRMFVTDAMEIRFVRGRFRQPGPATAWFRLRYPLIAGRQPSPFERVAAAADFGNGIGSELNWAEHVFINPDLTVYLEREPVDEWVALQSEMRVGAGSVAVAHSVLWDRRGRIGSAVQSLVIGPALSRTRRARGAVPT